VDEDEKDQQNSPSLDRRPRRSPSPERSRYLHRLDTDTLEAPHLQLALEQSDRTGVPGTRITLAVEARLPPGVHVYAPGTQSYKPIKLVLDPMPVIELKPVIYPPSKILFLPVISERVPVFDDHGKT
jgi:hypothetical protein